MPGPNYNAIKRTKELKRKAKREAKLARKHARKAEEEAAAGASTSQAGESPWPSTPGGGDLVQDGSDAPQPASPDSRPREGPR
jgi:hypothetical protein